MICYDFRCSKCGQDWEAIFASAADAVKLLPCDCGGEAHHVWKSFGPKGRMGGDKGIFPCYDIQAGRVFNDRKEKNAYLKSKGLVEMGPDEYKRSLSTPSQSEPDFSGLKEAMSEAWDETVVQGKQYDHKVLNDTKWIEANKEN